MLIWGNIIVYKKLYIYICVYDPGATPIRVFFYLKIIPAKKKQQQGLGTQVPCDDAAVRIDVEIPMRYRWDTEEIRMRCRCDTDKIPMICRWYANEIPMRCRWDTDDLPMGCRWYTDEIPIRYRRHTDGMPTYRNFRVTLKEPSSHLIGTL